MPLQLFAVVPDRRYIVLQLQVPTMDDEACEELRALLDEQMEMSSRPVILDLSRARFLPSLALGALVEQKKKLESGGNPLTIAGLSPNIRRALAISHLDSMFMLSDTLQAAVAAQSAI